MKIKDMDAHDLASEIKRHRNVAARCAGRAAAMPGTRDADEWQYSANHHADRAAKLTEIAKASTDPELPSFLKLYGVTL